MELRTEDPAEQARLAEAKALEGFKNLKESAPVDSEEGG